MTNASTTASFTITTAARAWYNGGVNYGILIKDSNEGGGTVSTSFSSNQDGTAANRPKLTLTFLQNVVNLKATPGDRSIALNWTFPTAIGTILEPYSGVVILRRTSAPVDKNSFVADGTAPPALCATVGNGIVVFVGNTAATTFTDNVSDTCANGQPVNGTAYYYKVFTYDNANNYSTNATGLASPLEGGSTYNAEAGGVPNPAGSTQTPLWMIGTHSSTLAAPGLTPGSQVDIGSDTGQIFALDPSSGARLYQNVALGGIISGRPPILDSTDASVSKQVAYVTCQDNYLYAIDTATGQILWQTEPGNFTTNAFQGGAGVVMKKFSTASYTLTNDLVIAGTRNGATTTGNRIFGIDGNTGTLVWTYTGVAGATTALDLISSTPLVDYKNTAIWVTSHSNNGAAQPNLWKLNPVTGAVLFNANFGGSNIDSSPSLTFNSDVLFVGTNGVPAGNPANGRLYAINPVTGGAVTGASVAFFDGADGAIRGFPYVVTTFSPYTVVFSTATKVQAVSFNSATNTFTSLWSSPAINSPSAPVVSTVLSKVYVGTGDGFLDELNVSNGALNKQVIVNTFYPAVIGDPALDEVAQRVYVSTTTNDQRAYGFAIPF